MADFDYGYNNFLGPVDAPRAPVQERFYEQLYFNTLLKLKNSNELKKAVMGILYDNIAGFDLEAEYDEFTLIELLKYCLNTFVAVINSFGGKIEKIKISRDIYQMIHCLKRPIHRYVDDQDHDFAYLRNVNHALTVENDELRNENRLLSDNLTVMQGGEPSRARQELQRKVEKRGVEGIIELRDKVNRLTTQLTTMKQNVILAENKPITQLLMKFTDMLKAIFNDKRSRRGFFSAQPSTENCQKLVQDWIHLMRKEITSNWSHLNQLETELNDYRVQIPQKLEEHEHMKQCLEDVTLKLNIVQEKYETKSQEATRLVKSLDHLSYKVEEAAQYNEDLARVYQGMKLDYRKDLNIFNLPRDFRQRPVMRSFSTPRRPPKRNTNFMKQTPMRNPVRDAIGSPNCDVSFRRQTPMRDAGVSRRSPLFSNILESTRL